MTAKFAQLERLFQRVDEHDITPAPAELRGHETRSIPVEEAPHVGPRLDLVELQRTALTHGYPTAEAALIAAGMPPHKARAALAGAAPGSLWRARVAQHLGFNPWNTTSAPTGQEGSKP